MQTVGPTAHQGTSGTRLQGLRHDDGARLQDQLAGAAALTLPCWPRGHTGRRCVVAGLCIGMCGGIGMRGGTRTGSAGTSCNGPASSGAAWAGGDASDASA